MIVAVPTAYSSDAEAFAAALDAHPDFRVQRRLVPMDRRLAFGPSPTVTGCALDVETTGLNHREDAVIELALQRFRVDRHGRIVEVGRSHRWLEDPGAPIPPTISALTGLTDAQLAGRRICDAEAYGLIVDADFVVAHNARFDRPFVERRLPDVAGRPWVCSMRDVDWRGLRFEGRSLPQLLWQTGWFYDAHRADVDVSALLRLLDHVPPGGDGTVLSMALARASEPTWLVEARDAPFGSKDLLKARGYGWNPVRRLWSSEVGTDAIVDEIAWCRSKVYAGRGEPDRIGIDWTTRYAIR